jgi:hypothetical protein
MLVLSQSAVDILKIIQPRPLTFYNYILIRYILYCLGKIVQGHEYYLQWMVKGSLLQGVWFTP